MKYISGLDDLDPEPMGITAKQISGPWQIRWGWCRCQEAKEKYISAYKDKIIRMGINKT